MNRIAEIRREYETMREQHNSAIDNGQFGQARQILADYRERLQNYKMLAGWIDKLASLEDSAFINSVYSVLNLPK
tara:strand:+ start:2146 stop:2370 length:225 start_codon:yes stop_codon:yes gene_type:complete